MLLAKTGKSDTESSKKEIEFFTSIIVLTIAMVPESKGRLQKAKYQCSKCDIKLNHSTSKM